MKITKNMKISEIIKNYPKSILIFMKYGLSCVGCPLAMNETLEEGAKVHGIDVNDLLKELNKEI